MTHDSKVPLTMLLLGIVGMIISVLVVAGALIAHRYSHLPEVSPSHGVERPANFHYKPGSVVIV